MQGAPTQIGELPGYLVYVLLNPAFNPQAAFLLYASIALLLLIALVVGIILLMRTPEDEQAAPAPRPSAEERLEQVPPGEVFEGLDAEEPAQPVRARGMGVPERVGFAVVAVFVLAAAWAAAGYTTADAAVCKDCHWPTAAHAKAAAGADRHADVACVSCHEPGGTLGRYLTDVPARLLHFAESRYALAPQVEYGRVTARACSRCHRPALDGTTADKTRGLKMSHKEPLDAAATCTDCHRFSGGVVSVHNAGMKPCLRCHDAKRASAECDTCHDEKAATAARARSTSFADVQVAEVTCGGCHDEKRECDYCHGTRMPHSREFMSYAHARAGAADFWYNGGKGCSRCHYAGRRPCQRCHTGQLGKAHGTGKTWLATGHQKAESSACNSCHQRYAYAATRDFCQHLCHTPAARAESPR